jgi:hypothetical protein
LVIFIPRISGCQRCLLYFQNRKNLHHWQLWPRLVHGFAFWDPAVHLVCCLQVRRKRLA